MSGERKKTVDLIIPVYRPGEELPLLLERIVRQSVLPEHIFLLYTLSAGEEIEHVRAYFHSLDLKGRQSVFLKRLEIIPVQKEDFDHGGTRDAGAKQSTADYLLYMTQDAMPVDCHLIEQLLLGFRQENVGICYGRQLPRKGAGLAEQMTRRYNYPEQSRLQTLKSVQTLGIKAYFCSDVCAMYDRSLYEKLGGFVSPTIFNEDMIMASKVIEAGWSVYYAAEAKVIHSHAYTCMQQFHRNFDLGVSQRQYREIFDRVSSEKEGAGFAKQIIGALCRRGQIGKAFSFACQCGFRLLGYKLGKNYEKLPHGLVMRCTMSKDYVLFRK